METIKEFVEIVGLLLSIILPLVKMAIALALSYTFISVIVIYIRWKNTKQSVVDEIIPWWTGLIQTWIEENIGISISNMFIA